MESAKLILVIALSLIFLVTVNSQVILTADNFDDLVIHGDKHSFIKFYAPWCGHCKALAPTWTKLHEDLAENTGVQIAKIDCTEHGSICTKYGVTGYPSLKSFKRGDEDLKEYSGGRDLGAMKRFIREEFGSGCDVSEITKCTEKEQNYYGKFISKGVEEAKKEAERLDGMKNEKMTPALKEWLYARRNILNQIAAGTSE